MLAAQDISFAYNDGVPVLSHVSLSVAKGEIVALLGASGCGKSTLLRVLAGLEGSSGGSVDWSKKERFSFVFQDPSLMPWATVAENTALPLTLAGEQNSSAVTNCLAEVGLKSFEDRYPASLSGGQKMRVSIARAMVSEPGLMFLDEPFGALDEILRFQMNELLLRVRAQHDLACLFVTHSIYEAAYLADRVLVMHSGEIIGECVPGLDRGLSPEVQRSSVPFIAAVTAINHLLAEGGV